MLNAIKMDFYKMFKSKSTWILLVVSMAFSFLTVYIMDTQIKMFKDNPKMYEQVQEAVEGDSVNIGFSAKSDNIAEHMDGLKFSVVELFTSVVAGNMLGIFITIFCLIFFNSEIRTGYIKNIAGQFTYRRYLVFSKLLVSLLYSVLIFGTSLVAFILGSKVFLGYVIFGGASVLMKVVLTQLLLQIAICSLVLLIVNFFRNTAGSIVLCMCIISGVTNMLIGFLSKILTGNDIVTKENFNLCDYILTGNIANIGLNSTNHDILTACIVGGIFLIVTVIASVFVTEKQDIR